MRPLLTGALLLLGAAPLAAQQDSTARRDSLLERERRRIHGEAASRVAPATVEDTVLRARFWRVGLGVVSGATWLELEPDQHVTSGFGPVLSGEIVWPHTRWTQFDVTARATRTGVSVEQASAEWDAGSVWALDAFAGATRLFDARFAVRVGGGATFLLGGDVSPFTESLRVAPGAELTGTMRLTERIPLALAVTAQALRYGGGGSAPVDARAGLVPRLFVEVRHGR